MVRIRLSVALIFASAVIAPIAGLPAPSHARHISESSGHGFSSSPRATGSDSGHTSVDAMSAATDNTNNSLAFPAHIHPDVMDMVREPHAGQSNPAGPSRRPGRSHTGSSSAQASFPPPPAGLLEAPDAPRHTYPPPQAHQPPPRPASPEGHSGGCCSGDDKSCCLQ